MSPAILAAGSSGGDSIGFEPHEAFPSTEIRTLKICEGYRCGKTFMTLEMAGLKICPQCREREEKLREERQTEELKLAAGE